MKTNQLAVLLTAAVLMFTAASCPQTDPIAKIVARRVTVEILQSRPQYRPAFIASTVTIDLLLKNDATTRAEFIAALQQLKVRELKGVEGALIITDLLDLIDAAMNDKPWLSDGLPRLRSFLTAVNDGMVMGINLSTVPEMKGADLNKVTFYMPARPQAIPLPPNGCIINVPPAAVQNGGTHPIGLSPDAVLTLN